jgi:hypothetical protein
MINVIHENDIPCPSPDMSAMNILDLGLPSEPIAALALIIVAAIGKKTALSRVLVKRRKRKVFLVFINGSALFERFTSSLRARTGSALSSRLRGGYWK